MKKFLLVMVGLALLGQSGGLRAMKEKNEPLEHEQKMWGAKFSNKLIKKRKENRNKEIPLSDFKKLSDKVLMEKIGESTSRFEDDDDLLFEEEDLEYNRDIVYARYAFKAARCNRIGLFDKLLYGVNNIKSVTASSIFELVFPEEDFEIAGYYKKMTWLDHLVMWVVKNKNKRMFEIVLDKLKRANGELDLDLSIVVCLFALVKFSENIEKEELMKLIDITNCLGNDNIYKKMHKTNIDSFALRHYSKEYSKEFLNLRFGISNLINVMEGRAFCSESKFEVCKEGSKEGGYCPCCIL